MWRGELLRHVSNGHLSSLAVRLSPSLRLLLLVQLASLCCHTVNSQNNCTLRFAASVVCSFRHNCNNNEICHSINCMCKKHQLQLNAIIQQEMFLIVTNLINYSPRIIFSHTFNPEPNTNCIGWTVSEIWPFKIIQDGWRPRSWIWSDPENPTLEPNMKWIGWSVAEIWPFEIFQNARLVGRRSSTYTLFSCTPLRYVRNLAREE